MHLFTHFRDLKVEHFRNALSMNSNVWNQLTKLVQVEFCNDNDGFQAKSLTQRQYDPVSASTASCLRRTADIPENHSAPVRVWLAKHGQFSIPPSKFRLRVLHPKYICVCVPSWDAEVGIYVIIMKLLNSENFCPLKLSWRFGGICRLHLYGWTISQARTQQVPIDPEYEDDIFLRNVVAFQRTTRRYIPEYRILVNHHRENLRPY
jgi:hypothetical protein